MATRTTQAKTAENTLEVKKIKKVGGSVEFSIVGKDLELTHTLKPTSKISRLMIKASDEKREIDERAVAGEDLMELVLGAENYDKIVDWLAENCDDIDAEREVLVGLTTEIYSKALPKAQPTDRKP